MLWSNWWPLLTAIMYVLVPMPYLFFGAAGNDAYGYGSLASGWVHGALLLWREAALPCQ